VEPAFSFQLATGDYSLIELVGSYTTQMQNPQFLKLASQGGFQPAIELSRNRALNGAVAFKLRKAINFNSKLFYSHFSNLPTDGDFINPVLNGVESSIFGELTNQGTGRSYGFDLMLDKEFANAFYININSSIFETTYDDYKATNSFGFTSNVIVSKSIINKKKNVLKANLAFHYRGGAYVNNIVGSPVTQTQLSDYKRCDLRLQYTYKKKNQLTLDIQNLLNFENDAYYTQVPDTGELLLEKQLGTIPILSYKSIFGN